MSKGFIVGAILCVACVAVASFAAGVLVTRSVLGRSEVAESAASATRMLPEIVTASATDALPAPASVAPSLTPTALPATPQPPVPTEEQPAPTLEVPSQTPEPPAPTPDMPTPTRMIPTATSAPPSPTPGAQGGLVHEIQNAQAVMWIGAHADDELFAPGLLGMASHEYDRDTCVVSLKPGLMYRAQNEQSAVMLGVKEPFINIDTRTLCGVPQLQGRNECVIEKIREVIQQKQPSLIITFDPAHGYRGHPEHKVAADMVGEALLRSGVPAKMYYVLNKDPNLGWKMDATEPTDILDLDVYSDAIGKTWWDLKVDLMRMYGDVVPAAKRFAEDMTFQNRLKRNEFYRLAN